MNIEYSTECGVYEIFVKGTEQYLNLHSFATLLLNFYICGCFLIVGDGFSVNSLDFVIIFRTRFLTSSSVSLLILAMLNFLALLLLCGYFKKFIWHSSCVDFHLPVNYTFTELVKVGAKIVLGKSNFRFLVPCRKKLCVHMIEIP